MEQAHQNKAATQHRASRGDGVNTPRTACSNSAALAATANVVIASTVSMSVPVRRIVTFHLNDLSSLLFTLPALHALRESFPARASAP
jgi:hypothetical protein